jgi:hypothetical protein
MAEEKVDKTEKTPEQDKWIGCGQALSPIVFVILLLLIGGCNSQLGDWAGVDPKYHGPTYLGMVYIAVVKKLWHLLFG